MEHSRDTTTSVRNLPLDDLSIPEVSKVRTAMLNCDIELLEKFIDPDDLHDRVTDFGD